jgi:Aminopeptidase N
MSKKVRRLFEGFQPKHYALTIDPDRDTLRVTGHVTVAGQKVGRPSQRITFHQHGLKITSAKITKIDKKGEREIPVARINHHRSLDEVRLHADELLYPGEYVVYMEFTGKVSSGMTGIYYSDYKVDDEPKRMVSTQFESHHAREAFPCIDEPEAKATFDLTLISPAGEIAISNMPIKSQTVENGKAVTTFETTPLMSTYLLAFAYGDLQKVSAKTKNGVEVSIWSTKAHKPAALEFGLEIATKALDFFEDYYHTPFPLPKIDHVAIPDFSAGAMENWGLITYREVALLADPETVSQSGREIIAETICHELSHQWFGNLVTMRWWDNLWLNESFANVMAFVAVDHLFPEWQVWHSYAADDGLSALRRDAIAGVQAVQAEVNHPDEINSIFDPSIVYAKGGRLLNVLSHYLGETDFRNGLKEYFAKHAYGNTTGDDLWEALGKASGKDVAAFMKPWLERSGYPVVTVSQEGFEIAISQKHFLLDPAKADEGRIWPAPLLSDNKEVPELLTAKTANVKLASNDYIYLNRHASGHYIVHYTNPEHVKAIGERARDGKLDDSERLFLLHDSSMLARAGINSLADTLGLLEYFANETSEPVWDIISLIIADARRFIDSDESLEPLIKGFIRQLIQKQYERLGWDPKEGESSHDTKLRATIIGLGVYSEHPEILSRALELFGKYKKDSSVVHPELRSIVFSAAVRHQSEGAFQYLLDLEEYHPKMLISRKTSSAACPARVRPTKPGSLGRLKDSQKVRHHDVIRWVTSMLRNRHIRSHAWQWVQDNWDWIKKTFEGDHHYDYYPRYIASAFNTEKLANEYKAFFEPKLSELALKQNILLGIEELDTRIAWIKRDLPAIQIFLNSFFLINGCRIKSGMTGLSGRIAG